VKGGREGKGVGEERRKEALKKKKMQIEGRRI